MRITTILLIPGLWMTALCWEQWVKRFSGKGYCIVARSWPGMEGDVEPLRHDPSSFASLGLTDVVHHYEQIVSELESPPIIIGYGFGALVTQILLDHGWGAAGAAIAPAPMQGLLSLLIPTLRAFLSDVLEGNKANSITRTQFRRAFANTLTESESQAAYDRYVVPGPNRMLLQAAFAKFTPRAATSINFRNDTRAPLLLVAGGKDRVAPPSLVKANFNLHRKSRAKTEYKEFPGEGHLALLRNMEIADYTLNWTLSESSGSNARPASNQSDGWSVQL